METPIGKVIHYFGKAGVAGVALSQPLQVGERVKIINGEHEWEEEITSMQVDKKPI